MADGSSLFRVKEAIFTALDLTTLNMLYDSPTSPDEFMGADGLAAVAWLGDNAEATIEPPLLMGLPLWMDEHLTVHLIIQVLGQDTSYDQRTVDQIAVGLLGNAYAALLSDPSLNIPDDDDIQVFSILPAGHKARTGFLPTGARAAGFEVDIQVEARLKLATVNGNP